MHDCVGVIIGGSNTLMDPCRSNIGGGSDPCDPAALTPMVAPEGFDNDGHSSDGHSNDVRRERKPGNPLSCYMSVSIRSLHRNFPLMNLNATYPGHNTTTPARTCPTATGDDGADCLHGTTCLK